METPHVLCKDVKVGKGTTIWNFVNLYGCEIGEQCMIGSLVEIQKGVRIGNRTSIQSHAMICEKVIIGSHCFVGHGVMFINDTFRSGRPNPNAESWKKTTVGDNVSIGSNATIMPVNIGRGAVIGAGSVVIRDVPADAIVAGNPARIIRHLGKRT